MILVGFLVDRHGQRALVNQLAPFFNGAITANRLNIVIEVVLKRLRWGTDGIAGYRWLLQGRQQLVYPGYLLSGLGVRFRGFNVIQALNQALG